MLRSPASASTRSYGSLFSSGNFIVSKVMFCTPVRGGFWCGSSGRLCLGSGHRGSGLGGRRRRGGGVGFRSRLLGRGVCRRGFGRSSFGRCWRRHVRGGRRQAFLATCRHEAGEYREYQEPDCRPASGSLQIVRIQVIDDAADAVGPLTWLNAKRARHALQPRRKVQR